MELLNTASRNYEEIKDKYFFVFVPAPAMNASMLFDTVDEAKAHLLSVTKQPINNLAQQYRSLEREIESSGGAMMILNVEKEVLRYEQEHQYGGENFRDRQHFIDVIVFGDPE